jgi:hypothetical protein
MSVSPEPEAMADLDELLGPEPQPQSARAIRYPFQNWTDDELDAEPDTGFLIGDEDRPVLGETALWQVFGKMKSAKTLYCLDLAFCVAFGLPFHGLPVLYPEGRQVVYILAEGGAKRNYKRVRALWFKYEDAMREKGFTSLKQAREKTGNFIYTDQTIKLAESLPTDPTSPESFIQRMKQQGVVKPTLVVLDTWARALAESGGHASSNDHVGASLLSCDNIRKAFGGCTLIMVAHAGKATDGAKGLTEPMDNADGVTECQKNVKNGYGEAATFTFKQVIVRHGQEGYTLTCNVRKQFDEAPAPILVSGDSVTGAINLNNASDSVKAWLDALKKLPGMSGKVTDWRAAGVAAGVVKGKDDQPAEASTIQKSFKRAREELVRLKAVRIIDGVATATRPGEPVGDGNDFETGGDD